MKSIFLCFAIIFAISAVGAVTPGDVWLFKGKHRQGYTDKVNVKENICVNFKSDWNNLVKSVSVSTGTCILAYDDSDCQGAAVRLEKDSLGNDDLSEIRWTDRISSLARC